MSLSNFNFDKLPQVDLAENTITPARRLPRFEGDVSELPNQACWVLQNLLYRRYISKSNHPELWSWLMEHRRVLASRLCELDLKLRVHEELEVAYAEPAELESQTPHSRKILRREPLGTYASILALHLANIARSSRDEQIISREDIHDLFGTVRHRVNRDEAMKRGRIDDAINRLTKVEILIATTEDDNSYVISPVILAIMTGQMVDQLTREFDQLRRAAESGGQEEISDNSDAEAVETEAGWADDGDDAD
jgi:hypothetical protein